MKAKVEMIIPGINHIMKVEVRGILRFRQQIMQILLRVGESIVVKSYCVCRIAFQTIIALLFICWTELQNKINNWTNVNRRMSRQMGMVVSQCLKKPDDQEDNDNRPLVDQLREQISLNGKLQEEVQKLREKVEDQNEMIEKQFGKDIERTAKGRYNNTGELIQPTTLSIKCREIFDEEWRSVMRSLFRGNKELTGIKFLSRILEDCQSFCQSKANSQLMKFVNPLSEDAEYTVEEVIKSTEDLHYLYKLRRTVGLHEPNKAAVIKMFDTECKAKEDFRKVTEEIKEDEEEMKCLEEYISKCSDLCWQCAISDPSVLLKFDVLGKHVNEVSDNFQEYHYKGAVEEGGFSNTVMQVVWPAVVMNRDHEESDILVDNAKGYVIAYASSAV